MKEDDQKQKSDRERAQENDDKEDRKIFKRRKTRNKVSDMNQEK